MNIQESVLMWDFFLLSAVHERDTSDQWQSDEGEAQTQHLRPSGSFQIFFQVSHFYVKYLDPVQYFVISCIDRIVISRPALLRHWCDFAFYEKNIGTSSKIYI